MRKTASAGETIFVGLALGLVGLLVIAAVLGLTIAIFGGLVMLLMNCIMPMFDVNYPLSYTQAGGVGVGLIIVRALVSGLFHVNVKK